MTGSESSWATPDYTSLSLHALMTSFLVHQFEPQVQESIQRLAERIDKAKGDNVDVLRYCLCLFC